MKINRIIKDIEFPVLLFGFSFLIFSASLVIFVFLLNKSNLLPTPARASSGYISWPVFDGGVDDPGTNYNESSLNTSNVSGLKVLWKATLPAAADDSVVEEAAVSTSSGLVNMVFVNTIKGNLVAYNALTGAKIWEADPSEVDYNGQGTKSSPAIDPSGNYIYAYAVDGYIHKYNIATGAEISGGGFPAQITLLPNNTEKGSSSINIGNGYLYMTTSGNDGDYGHYVGHVVAVNLSTGVKTVWNAECSNITTLLFTSGANFCANTQSGIWARPGVKIDPVTGNVFVATGNGLYDANSGGHDWGDSLIELTPNLGSVVDSYTPNNYSSLQSGDADLGSTSAVILPKQSNSNTPYMLVQAGKDHIVKLLNRTNLSGQGGPGHTGGELQTITISDETHEQPAVWVDGSGNAWVFVTDESGDLYAFKLVTSGGVSSLTQVYEKSLGISSSPFVANGVLYLDGNNVLALNPTTGSTLFNSSSVGVSLNQHWEAPVVVNGELLTPDDNGNLYALYVPGVTPTSPPTASGGSGSSGSGGSNGSSGSSGSSSSPKKKTDSSTSLTPSTTQPSTIKPTTSTTSKPSSSYNSNKNTVSSPKVASSSIKPTTKTNLVEKPVFYIPAAIVIVSVPGMFIYNLLVIKNIAGAGTFLNPVNLNLLDGSRNLLSKLFGIFKR